MRKNSMRHRVRSPQHDLIVGLVAIIIGAMFLLDNLQLIDFHHALHFWPVLFVAIGVAKLTDRGAPGRFMVGLGFIAAGVIMTLNRLGMADFSWQTMWPVVLIIIGLASISKAAGRERSGQTGDDVNAPGAASDVGNATGANVSLADSELDIRAILGGFQRRVATADFRGGRITAMMGGVEIDLRQSSIKGEAVIDVLAICGGIVLKVPGDWSVVMHGQPILGGFEEKTATPPDESKRLIIRGTAIFGGVEVSN